MTFVRLCKHVRAEIAGEHRYAHAVRVARLADRLAQHHGLDANAARIAGIVHDIARLYSHERLIAECTRRNMPIDAFERRNPVVLHARLGAALAREQLGIDDAAVLSAIEKHTVAAETLSELDAVVYLADGLEPGRDFPEREALVSLAFEDLGRATYALLGSTVAYLRARNLEVAPQTLAALHGFSGARASQRSIVTA